VRPGKPDWVQARVFLDARWGCFGFFHVMNADGSGQTNLTNRPRKDLSPSWSADGTRIYSETDRDANRYDPYVMNAGGSGQAPGP